MQSQSQEVLFEADDDPALDAVDPADCLARNIKIPATCGLKLYSSYAKTSSFSLAIALQTAAATLSSAMTTKYSELSPNSAHDMASIASIYRRYHSAKPCNVLSCCQDSLNSLVLWRILDAFRPFRPSFGFFGFFGSRTWRQVSFGLLAHHMPAQQLRLTELNSFLDNLCATDVRPCATDFAGETSTIS